MSQTATIHKNKSIQSEYFQSLCLTTAYCTMRYPVWFPFKQDKR